MLVSAGISAGGKAASSALEEQPQEKIELAPLPDVSALLGEEDPLTKLLLAGQMGGGF